jgi:uncharacterized protein (TIGR03437 family)
MAGASALAQQYTISTVAGGAPPATPVAAANAAIGHPNRVATDSAGNVYFSSGNAVFKLSGGTLALVAGNSRPGYSGDNGAATAAQLNNPQGIAVDRAGNIYIADYGNNRVRVVSAQGIITTFAGNGTHPLGSGGIASYGDGGPANQAQLYLPSGLAIDSAGNVYIADTADNAIRKVDANGNITTFAGDSYAFFGGDAGPANQAQLYLPSGVAVDSSGNVYIADSGNAAIRKVTTDGNINTIVGDTSNGNPPIGYAGDGGPAYKASLRQPTEVMVDSSGNLYIADTGNSAIRKVDTKNNISTIAGTGTPGAATDGSDATKATLNFPSGVAVDSSGNVYIADSLNLRIRKVASGGGISTVAGNGVYSYSGDGGPATAAQLNSPEAVAADSSGNLYIADTGNNVVRKVVNGTITNFAGNASAGSGSGQLNGPQGLAVDSSGNVYISDTQNNRVLKATPAGAISTYAGNGAAGFGGDGGAAGSAQLNSPLALAVDSGGNLYIADFGNSRIRKVTPGGAISTVAGNGAAGYSGDGLAAANAQINLPQGVAVDAAGDIFIADSGNGVVRMVTPGGTITTVAGNGLRGYAGDGGQATRAELASPAAVAADTAGNLYIVDSGRIRKVLPNGVIVTIAGTGATGYSGDGGTATAATLNMPSGMAMNAAGNLYVADTGNNAVRVLQSAGYGIAVKAVTNAASNLTGPVAPGEVVVLWGSGMGPSNLVQFTLSSSGMVGTSLAGTQVFFGSTAAPVIYTWATQVAAVVPYGVNGSSVPVTVMYQGQPSATISVPVTSTAPAIFTLDSSGSGQAAAINVTGGSVNGSAHPVKAGDYITLYITGAGQTNPQGTDGLPNAVPLPLPNAKVTATVGGKDATVQYAGGAPGMVAGVMQVNVQIPSGLAAGPVPVVLQVGGVSTQTGITIVTSGS